MKNSEHKHRVKKAALDGAVQPCRIMYACMHVCMYVCWYVCMHACMFVRTYVCMHVCTFSDFVFKILR